MAGHSKWANIRHRKNRQDARRSRLFSRLAREVAVAARLGGPNPADNARLRQAISAATAANLPRDNIERAIGRGRQPQAGALEELRYTGRAPGGIAVLVDCITDNRNRTVAAVRNAFRRCGGSMEGTGSMEHLFQRRGRLSCPSAAGHDRIFELAAAAGAEEVTQDGADTVEVLTAPERLEAVCRALMDAGCAPLETRQYMHPLRTVPLDADRAAAVRKLLDMLDELEDVQELHTNAAFPESAA